MLEELADAYAKLSPSQRVVFDYFAEIYPKEATNFQVNDELGHRGCVGGFHKRKTEINRVLAPYGWEIGSKKPLKDSKTWYYVLRKLPVKWANENGSKQAVMQFEGIAER